MHSKPKAQICPSFAETDSEKEVTSPIYNSLDKGATWFPFGYGLPEGLQVNLIKAIGNELIIGTEGSGLFISTGNKYKWERISENLPSQKATVIQIVDNQIIVGLFQHGVFKSDDFGESWSSLNYNLSDKKVMAVLPFKNEMFISADHGIYRLRDKKWAHIYGGEQVVSLNAYKGSIIAGSVKGVLKSSDNGDSWEVLHQNGGIHNITIVNDKIIAMYINNDVFFSSDLGNNWDKAWYYPKQSSYVYEVAAVDDVMIMSNNYGVHQSTDGGLNWKNFPSNNDYYFNDFLVDGNEVYGVTRRLKR